MKSTVSLPEVDDEVIKLSAGHPILGSFEVIRNPRPFWSNPRPFWSNPRLFWRNPRTFWSNRRTFWSNARTSWSKPIGPFEVILGLFEVIVGPFEVILGPYEVILGPFEVILAPFEVILAPFEVTLALFEVILGPFEVFLGQLVSSQLLLHLREEEVCWCQIRRVGTIIKQLPLLGGHANPWQWCQCAVSTARGKSAEKPFTSSHQRLTVSCICFSGSGDSWDKMSHTS